MPNTREKLIELFRAIAHENCFGSIYNIADYLVANGVTVNAEKYKEIDKFIESKVLDGKEYPTAKLYYEDYQEELERLYNGVTVQDCGHWIKTETNYTCSNCGGNVISWTGDYDGYERERGICLMNYCPNCGAKMMPQPPKGE